MRTGLNSNGQDCVRDRRNGAIIGLGGTGGTVSEARRAGAGGSAMQRLCMKHPMAMSCAAMVWRWLTVTVVKGIV